MKFYPKSYTEPIIDGKPVVSPQKKTAALTKMKAHMEAEQRGFYLKELVNFVQDELHADSLHIKDEEVAVWVKDVDKDWGWHPQALEPEPIAVDKKL